MTYGAEYLQYKPFIAIPNQLTIATMAAIVPHQVITAISSICVLINLTYV